MNDTIKLHANHPKRASLPQVIIFGVAGLLVFSLAVAGYQEISKILEITNGALAHEALRLPASNPIQNQPISEAILELSKVALLDARTSGFAMATRNGERGSTPRDFSPQVYSQPQFDSFRNWDRFQLDKIYQITDRQPVPINLDPWTIVTPVRNAQYLVHFDFVDATYHKDAPRAMKALRAYKWLNACFSEYGTTLEEMIANSVKYDLWSDEDFSILRKDFLAPIDYISQIRKTELTNYAYWLSKHKAVAGSLGDLYDLDTGSRYVSTLQLIDQKNFDIYRWYYSEKESERRLALMAIAAKQFHKKTGTWPTDFANLVSYDLPDKLWDSGRYGSFELRPNDQGGVKISFVYRDSGNYRKELEVIVQ